MRATKHMMSNYKGTYEAFLVYWMHYIKINDPNYISKPKTFISSEISNEDLQEELNFRNNFYKDKFNQL